MAYEMKKGETITTLLSYAGGFTGDAYRDAIRLFRLNGKEKQIYNVGQDDYQSFVLTDGDELSVEAVLHVSQTKLKFVVLCTVPAYINWTIVSRELSGS